VRSGGSAADTVGAQEFSQVTARGSVGQEGDGSLSRTVKGEPRRNFRRGAIPLLAALALVALIAPGTSQAAKVRVMTRNMYLGADLSPGTNASNLQELVNAAGQILNQVDANDFRVRAKGMAKEILNQNPDLVGLQEGALWRDAPCTDNPLAFTATHVRPGGDFLQLLLNQLNKGQQRYRYAVIQPEFDFQIYANTDGNESTGTPFGCDIEGRLTMRDAILARTGTRVRTSNPQSANFNTLLQVTPGGVPINVTRGWTAVDAKVAGAPKFRFVNTHLEAFDNQPTNHTNQDTDVHNGRVREAQAKELIAPGGPATGSLPVVLVGDLNSDTRTPLKPGDQLADGALLRGGFKERSTYNPLGCCLNADVISDDGGGSVSDFDHKVDHVMTNDPAHVGLVRSTITGRRPVNGFWSSDHAGVASVLNFK
jgi:endonuclease/exonuclease/phosphatase family metal-dependent hydrolase